MRKAIIATALACIWFAPAARAGTVNDTTPCSSLTHAFDVNDDGAIRSAHVLIQTVMDTIDSRHGDDGEPAFMAELSDEDRLVMTSLTVSWCRRHPKSTIHNAAAQVYDGARSLGKVLAERKRALEH